MVLKPRKDEGHDVRDPSPLWEDCGTKEAMGLEQLLGRTEESLPSIVRWRICCYRPEREGMIVICLGSSEEVE